MRVVSLVPSLSETLRPWVDLVGVTRFCEQPGLATVGGTKDPDVAAIVALRPDLVVVNDEENRREDVEALAAAGVPVHVTRVRAVADVAPMLAALAAAVADPDEPPLVATPAALEVPSVATAPRRAFVPIWRRPWMTLSADTYGSSLLGAIRVVNVFADATDRYPEVTLEAAAATAPDLVVAPSEPYPFAPRHGAELARVAADVRFVDGRDLFWWGSRTPGAIERLRDALRP